MGYIQKNLGRYMKKLLFYKMSTDKHSEMSIESAHEA